MGIILLDVDGVLADFTGTLLYRLGLLFGGEVPKRSDIKEFDMKKWLPNPKHYNEAVKMLDERSTPVRPKGGFAASVQPIEFAYEAVRELQSMGHDVYALTSPWFAPTWEFDRRQWLEEVMGIKHGKVISTSAKHLVRGDVFVDDRQKHVRNWLGDQENPYARAFLFAHEHNANNRDLPRLKAQEGRTVWNTGMVREIHDDAVSASVKVRRGTL